MLLLDKLELKKMGFIFFPFLSFAPVNFCSTRTVLSSESGTSLAQTTHSNAQNTFLELLRKFCDFSWTFCQELFLVVKC